MYFIVNNTKWGFYVFPGFIIEVRKYRYHWNLKIHLELHKKCVFLAALEVMKYSNGHTEINLVEFSNSQILKGDFVWI